METRYEQNGKTSETIEGDEIVSSGTKRCDTEDGPAVEFPNDGYKAWYFNGELHRVGGRCYMHANGDKITFMAYNIEDGPAFRASNGYRGGGSMEN